jgi:hypothetical protein
MSLGLGLGLNKNSRVGGSPAPFTLADLGLSLDLLMNRTPITENQGEYSGDVALADSNIDVGAVVDRSADKAVLNSYTFDFSAGTDGIVPTGSNTLDGNIDGIKGLDNWIRMTPSAIAEPHQMSLPVSNKVVGWGMTNGISVVRWRWKTYNNGWAVGTTFINYSSYGRQDVNIIDDTIQVHDEYALYHNAVFLYEGLNVVGMENDLGYWRDMIIDHIAGNHFVQTTASAKPHANFTDYTLDFDGIGMYLADDGGFSTLMETESAGMFTLFIRDDGTAVTQERMIYIKDNSSNRIAMWLNLEDFYITTDVGGVSNPITWANALQGLRGTWIKIQIGSDGSNYKLYINGADMGVPSSGTDNGDWGAEIRAGGNGINYVQIGQYEGVYAAMGLRHFGYVSGRVYTPTEITNINALPEYQAVYAP